jgi:hypothetical protein
MPQRCPLCTLHVFVANLPPRHQQHNADGTGESKWPQSPLCLCGETPTPSVPSVPLWCTYHPATGNTPGEESMPQRYIPLRPPCRCGTPTTLSPETRRRRKACRSATSLYAIRAAVVHLPPCHRKHAGGGKHAAALHPSMPSVPLWCTYHPATGNTPEEESLPQRYIPLCHPCRCGAPTTLPPETRRGRKACRSATSLCAIRAAVVHLPPCHRKHAGGGKHAAALHPSMPSVPLWCTYHPATGNTPGEESMPQRYIPLRPPCRCGTPTTLSPETRRGRKTCRSTTSLCALCVSVVHLRKHNEEERSPLPTSRSL